MRRAPPVIFAVALLAPELAHARHCREPITVVGYERCQRFGQRWSTNGALAIETGPTALVFDAGPHLRAAGFGGVFGERFGLAPSGVYFGGDFAIAAIAGTYPTNLARDASGTSPAATPGGVGQVVFVIGMQRALGRIGLGVETGPGLRIAQLPSAQPNDMIAQLVVAARARGILWLSPHWSLNAQVGADLAHPGSYEFAVLVGGHIVAYDNTR
jgi:hypothetical protein